MYIFSRTYLVLSSSVHTTKRLSDALGWKLSYLPNGTRVNSSLDAFYCPFFSIEWFASGLNPFVWKLQYASKGKKEFSFWISMNALVKIPGSATVNLWVVDFAYFPLFCIVAYVVSFLPSCL